MTERFALDSQNSGSGENLWETVAFLKTAGKLAIFLRTNFPDGSRPLPMRLDLALGNERYSCARRVEGRELTDMLTNEGDSLSFTVTSGFLDEGQLAVLALPAEKIIDFEEYLLVRELSKGQGHISTFYQDSPCFERNFIIFARKGSRLLIININPSIKEVTSIDEITHLQNDDLDLIKVFDLSKNPLAEICGSDSKEEFARAIQERGVLYLLSNEAILKKSERDETNALPLLPPNF